MTVARRSRQAQTSAEEQIRRAIDADELLLHYQPIVEISTGRITGVEALLRWQHPVGGLLFPDDFLPGVSETPSVGELTRWVLRTACTAAANWPSWTVSVNVTARDVLSEHFHDEVLSALARANLAPSHLVLELTETALVQDLPRAAATLDQLRTLGVQVALDDFGTGYSSMLYLRDLPVSSLKIDRTFISGMIHNGDDCAIVSTLLSLCRKVGLTSVAEGVETLEQHRMLTGLRCKLGQGFLWSRPQPATELNSDDAARLVSPNAPPDPSRAAVDNARRELAEKLLSQGASLHTIAAALNAAGHRTDRGARWIAASVAHLLSPHPEPSPHER